MNECISESDCVCELILPGSVSLPVVKLWDLVIKNYMLELSVSKLFYWEITEQRWQYIEWFCARDLRVMYAQLSEGYVVCVTVQQRIRLERD